jgi:hypothetical protein
MSARKDKGRREHSMTLRSSSELADDEGLASYRVVPTNNTTTTRDGTTPI